MATFRACGVAVGLLALSEGRSAGAEAADERAWLSQVIERIAASRDRHDFRVRSDASAVVSFTVNRGGQITGASVETTSGQPSLDEDALTIVRDAAPFPRPPQTMDEPVALSQPIHFVKTAEPTKKFSLVAVVAIGAALLIALVSRRRSTGRNRRST